MKSWLLFIIFKLKSHWRLFFKRMPLLRNATAIVLFVSLCLSFIRLDQPLSFIFYESQDKIQFIQADKLDSIGVLPVSIDLYDTAPLFIPTKWNYSTNVLPKDKNFNLEGFIDFEPLVVLDDFLSITNLENNNYRDFDITELEFNLVDPRLLTSWMSRGFDESLLSINPKGGKQTFRSQYRIDVLKGEFNSSETESFFGYILDTRPAINSLSPMVLLFFNDTMIAGNPIIYKSSLSPDFDQAILKWFENPKHIENLPKGYLMLTFYPN